MQRKKRLVGLGAAVATAASLAVLPAGMAMASPASDSGNGSVRELDGTLPDGTVWRMRVPSNWNGVLINDLDYQSQSDGPNYQLLTEEGYATSGTARPAWRNDRYDNLGELKNQLTVIEMFKTHYGTPRYVIQNGTSGGGLDAEAMAELYPNVINGAVVGCAHDNLGLTDQYLDLVFALKSLLAPQSGIPLVNIPKDASQITAEWRTVLTKAQQTPQGRAKIALAITMAEFPSWSIPGTAEPDPSDSAAVEKAMFDTAMDAVGFDVQVRYLFEHNAGGNPSSNVGVDYNSFFRNADQSQRWVVQDLYDNAGLSLGQSISAVNGAPRIAADKAAVNFYEVPGRTPSGRIQVPVLRTHTTGDDYVPPAILEGYQNQIRTQGREALYREAVVDRAGHCTFSPAETSVAVSTLLSRVKTGKWDSVNPAVLNAQAAALNAGGGKFVAYQAPRDNRAIYLDSGKSSGKGGDDAGRD